MALDDADLARDWKHFHETRNLDARSRLILHYLPFAERLARARHRTIPPNTVELDELTSTANVGLLKAIDKFDPTRNESFELFAAPTIRGHMLDELRTQDRVSRATRRAAREIESTRSALTRQLNRPPSIEEIATYQLIPATAVRATIAKIEASRTAHLDDPGTKPPTLPTPDPTLRNLQDAAQALIHAMPPTTQAILAIRYYERRPLAEAARRLGLSEATTSQAHASAVLALRALTLEHLTVTDGPQRDLEPKRAGPTLPTHHRTTSAHPSNPQQEEP